MSAEEERLWNIVRTNSLDFNSWTALIEDTEKVAEVCWFKIYKCLLFISVVSHYLFYVFCCFPCN